MSELIALIIGFVLLSGFWAMIDAAILSVSIAEVEEMRKKKLWGSTQLKFLIKDLTRAIVVIAILTNLTNIIGPVLIGAVSAHLFEDHIIGFITAGLTVVTIIFSEIIPKAIGAHYSPLISRMIAPVLRVFTFIFLPVVWVLERFVRVFKSGKRNIGTEDQIRALVDIGGRAGHIDYDEKELIHRAFILNDRKAKDVMTPIEDVIMLPLTATMKQAAKKIFRHQFSRYPVYGESPDDMKGMVLSSDVLQALADDEDKKPLSDLLREIVFVPSTIRCDDLLGVFRRKQIHLAAVQQNGKIVGIVTLEDVLEELVGEIEDEMDD
ncbi:MAG TPA: hemolysin family protein [Candidatus Peribacteraceae bacterium]|nr:hemolysin family protein [Candidatus Peribacteraceae bacterium]